MKKFKVLFASVFICFLSPAVFGQVIMKKEVPAWMETADDQGRSPYLIPKDARREKVGSQVIVEAPGEYAARRFYETEKVISEMKDVQSKFEKELKAIKEGIKEMNSKLDELKKSVTLNAQSIETKNKVVDKVSENTEE